MEGEERLRESTVVKKIYSSPFNQFNYFAGKEVSFSTLELLSISFIGCPWVLVLWEKNKLY